MDATHKLGGEGYTFWGGREGYATLLNTDMKRELDHLAALLHMAVDYKKMIGFKGQFYIEPKPREPSTHQYDSDAAACLKHSEDHRHCHIGGIIGEHAGGVGYHDPALQGGLHVDMVKTRPGATNQS